AQVGNVTDGNGVSTFFPAIYTDDDNNTAMVLGRSSGTDFASVHAVARREDDTPNAMGALTLLQEGFSSADGRWGDYFDIALDPTDGTTFWMVGEYQSAGSGWRTNINSFTLFILGDVNDDGAVNLLDITPFVDFISNGGFDPAADINGDGVINLLDIDGFVDLLNG
ncbi:MAG: dockerin type I domain-containing protein, partial [Planctomycetota bacterium]